MASDFRQIKWDNQVERDCREIVRLAVREDLREQDDCTTVALIAPDQLASARIVAREPGVVAGIPALAAAIDELNADVTIGDAAHDGNLIAAGQPVATLTGNCRHLLTVSESCLT